MEVKGITVQPCCALCGNFYDKKMCPLYETYNTSAEYGSDHFEKVAKYHICCDKFDIQKELITQ